MAQVSHEKLFHEKIIFSFALAAHRAGKEVESNSKSFSLETVSERIDENISKLKFLFAFHILRYWLRRRQRDWKTFDVISSFKNAFFSSSFSLL